jgi:multidrug efflux pump subunit AcrA (membrane-fusion protein)
MSVVWRSYPVSLDCVADGLAGAVSATGPVTNPTSVPLTFKSGGKLAEVNVAVGDRVVAGQVLARIDTTDLRLSLEQARATLAQAQANYANARAEADVDHVAPLGEDPVGERGDELRAEGARGVQRSAGDRAYQHDDRHQGGGDDDAGELGAGGKRRVRTVLVFAFDDQRVEEVERRRSDIDHRLAGVRFGIWHIAQLQ